MRFTTLILALLWVSMTAWGDRVELIYGDVLEGQIISETDSAVTIRGPFGEVTLPKSEVKTIQREGGVPSAPSAPSAPSPQAPMAPAPSSPYTPPRIEDGPEEDPWGNTDSSSPSVPLSPAPAPVPQAPAQTIPQVAPPVSSSAPPSPYEVLKRNVEIQASWNDLEIAYLQRAYVGGQVIQTQFIGRVVPPDYLRSKLTTPIPASDQFPQGGEVEYDMYRARSMLYQVVKAPNQPIQYIKMDMSRIPGMKEGDNPVESFHRGFIGAGTNEVLLQTIARNTQVIGSENTDGHDCWVLETVNTPDLIDQQVARYDSGVQESLRQQLGQLGRIRSWVGKEDLYQWRMENYSPQGDLLLSMKMITIKPNQGLAPQQLRMKVPRGTEFLDVTDMIASQFQQFAGMAPGVAPIPSPGELMQPYQSSQPSGGWPDQPGAVPGTLPQTVPGTSGLPPTFPQPGSPFFPTQQQSFTPPQAPVQQPQMPQAPPLNMTQSAPALQQQAMMPQQNLPTTSASPPYAGGQPQVYAPLAQPSFNQQMMLPAAPQGQVGYSQMPQQGMQQSYVIQPGQPMPQQQQQRSGSGGGLFSRLFGGGGGGGNQQQQQTGGVNPMMMGVNQAGNQTMMVPMVGGQPQFPTSSPPR